MHRRQMSRLQRSKYSRNNRQMNLRNQKLLLLKRRNRKPLLRNLYRKFWRLRLRMLLKSRLFRRQILHRKYLIQYRNRTILLTYRKIRMGRTHRILLTRRRQQIR